MSLPYPKIHVIINPAAGKDEPILNVLNDVFQPAGVDWEVSLTHAQGDGTRLAAAAAAAGVDLVAAYGGDGTQMEVACGLLGTGVPQAVLPGGTGNALAYDLGIPVNLGAAAGLLVGASQRRSIDLARCGDQVFMLRALVGLSTELAASREDKDRHGQLAYLQSTLKFIREATPVHYRALIDGEENEVDALVCYVLNAGTIGGVMGIPIPPVGDVNLTDGYLDFFALTQGLQSLGAITRYLLNPEESAAVIYHWRGREISLQADPPQEFWLDGERGGATPLTVTALPQALEVVVPPGTD